MAREQRPTSAGDSVISIIGPGMTITGNVETDGTVRIEGTVDGSIKAGKAVVIGKQGVVHGDIDTQDAVISGRVEGTLRTASRLELQATCYIEGEIYTRRMQLEEGAVLNGSVTMDEKVAKPATRSSSLNSGASTSTGGADAGKADPMTAPAPS